jgi:lipoprotein-anchoring transpeptidase ErfK/SrfK
MSSNSFADKIQVFVDKSNQNMYVVAGDVKYKWKVSTGRKGFSTPIGTFKPIRRHVKYFSKRYDNAPMPHSIFFYKGYAIHATSDIKRLGNVASHGCIRLHPTHAKIFFDLVEPYNNNSITINIVE